MAAAELEQVTDETALRAVQGDIQAFSDLAATFQGYMSRLACKILGNEQDAQDATQDALISVFRRLQHKPPLDIANPSPLQAFKVYLLRSSRHLAISMVRHRSCIPTTSLSQLMETNRNFDLSSGIDLTESGAFANLTRIQIFEAISALPAEQRAVATLINGQGLKYHEAAAILLIAEGTVKSRMHRARTNIRKSLDS